MPITDFLERNAKIYPNDIALVEINPERQPDKNISWHEFSLIETAAEGDKYRREISWRDFDIKANRFANLLFTRGVKKGDKIAILLMNCLEWLPIYFGILKTGAVVVPMNYRYSSDEIKYCLELADVRMLVFGPEFVERIAALEGQMPMIDNLFYVGKAGETPHFADNYAEMVYYCSSTVPPVEICDEDDGAIYFSSGTTGFPKAILHSHRALVCACYTERAHHHQTKDDVFLCIPPLYHTGAKMHWFGSLLAGGRSVLLRGVSPEWVLQTVSDELATIVWLLVPWAQDILDAIDAGEISLEGQRLSQWRLMHVGAQPVPPSLIKRWKSVFPSHEYDTNYGLSESIGPGTVHLGVENIHKVGAIGKAGYGWEVKIAGENGEPVKRGEVGELCAKGPGVMKCYYNDPKSTAEVLHGEWLLTGDMAMEDDDGFIYLVDRKKDVIITGGENLYPVEIENFIRRHDAVKDVAVIGLPHERLGEIAAAIIEIKPEHTLTEEEVNNFCIGMPRYKRPRKIIFAEVPRNATGKIEKPRLREIYCGESLVAQQIK
jgi:acyl-CoA synthetase (AMP-forming)/AMP-acid ligase II